MSVKITEIIIISVKIYSDHCNMSTEITIILVFLHIWNCKNFESVFEMVFDSDYTKLSEFKEKHHREGEFTDEDGVIALATGYYLGVTLRIFSHTNTKLYPYTQHNENQPTIFNIFLDDRSANSEHFQSLKQPEKNAEKVNLENKPEVKKIKPTKEAKIDHSNSFQNKPETTKINEDNPNSSKAEKDKNTANIVKNTKIVEYREDPKSLTNKEKRNNRNSVKNTLENNTTKDAEEKTKQKSTPKIVEYYKDPESSKTTTKKVKSNNNKNSVKDTLENKITKDVEKEIKQISTPNTAEELKKIRKQKRKILKKLYILAQQMISKKTLRIIKKKQKNLMKVLEQ